MISNVLLKDDSLSAKSRGLAVYMLAHPPEWRFTAATLAQKLPEGQSAIKGMLRELESRGYLRRDRKKGPKGTWVWDSVLCDDPAYLISQESV